MRLSADWDNSPEGAQHWSPETSQYHESWYMKNDHTWMSMTVDGFIVYGLECAWAPSFRDLTGVHLEPRP